MAEEKTVKSCLGDVREMRCSIPIAQTKSFILTGVLARTWKIQHTQLICFSYLSKGQLRPAEELYTRAECLYEMSTINTLLASLQLFARDFCTFQLCVSRICTVLNSPSTEKVPEGHKLVKLFISCQASNYEGENYYLLCTGLYWSNLFIFMNMWIPSVCVLFLPLSDYFRVFFWFHFPEAFQTQMFKGSLVLNCCGKSVKYHCNRY